MSISLQSQRFGGIVLAKCAGRIVEGSESSLLQQEVDSLLDESPYVVLDLSDIDFIDSSGLGLLVRLLNRARLAGGDLRICAAPPRVKEILRVTRLETILPPYESAGTAIAATYDHARSTRTLDRLATDILCVAESRDVLAYVCEILRQAGFGVLSSDNLPDALMLLRAVRPRRSSSAPSFEPREQRARPNRSIRLRTSMASSNCLRIFRIATPARPPSGFSIVCDR